MARYSTRQAAKKLGLSHDALATYIRVGKVPAPESVQYGERVVHIWTDDEIEHVRKLLPKIANGRKTRYQKLREKDEKQARAPKPRPVRHKKK
jgi:hypothetical protein